MAIAAIQLLWLLLRFLATCAVRASLDEEGSHPFAGPRPLLEPLASSDQERAYFMPEWEKADSATTPWLPVSNAEHKMVVQVQGRAYKQGIFGSWNRTAALGHVIHVTDPDGKLLARIMPREDTNSIFLGQDIYGVRPCFDGQLRDRYYEGAPLYRWAKLDAELYGFAGYKFGVNVRIATQHGFELRARFKATGFNNRMHNGYWKSKTNDEPHDIFATVKRAGADSQYIVGAGVDAGLVVLSHVAAIKCAMDAEFAG